MTQRPTDQQSRPFAATVEWVMAAVILLTIALVGVTSVRDDARNAGPAPPEDHI